MQVMVMPVEILQKKDDYVLNHCAKYLARENTDPRHAFGQFSPDDLRSRMCEPWRFPIIDSYNDGKDPQASYAFNAVTFVYASQALPSTENVSVLGTFANLY